MVRMRRLFVCGSLRKGEINHERFEGFGDRLIATGTIAGVLLKHLGTYPALFPSADANDRVVGEVYDVSDELGTVIDAWESGDGYAPRAVEVTTTEGAIQAEAYFYSYPERIAGHPVVVGGDWSLRDRS